jgi:4-cresol dehydrogenase (hydroxylating)
VRAQRREEPVLNALPPQLQAARVQWDALLGAEHVIADSASLERRQRTTYACDHRIPLVLRPGEVGEVSECLRIAIRHRIAVYPVSTGRNWGYGSSLPSTDGSVLLDLSRMDRIVDFDEPLAYVTIEPGVTQQQLFEFLRERGSALWMDATGSSPHCSVLANALERGFGHTPYGDHFGNACALQVVLADGEVVETGFGQFGNVPAAPVYRPGVGPSLEGLFAQSNLGIVTRMTVWLMPAPEYFQAFFFMARDDARLEPLVDVLRRLRLEATLRSAVHLANDYKVAASLGQYPWNAMAGDTPLSAGVLQELARRRDFGAWNGSGALYGTRDQVGAARRRIKALLRPHVDKLRFIDDRTLGMAARVQRPYRWVTGTDLAEVIELVRPVYELMKGVPTSDMLRSTYWRKRIPPPPDPDPDRDRCGLIWCTPVSPAEPRNVRNMVEIVHKVFARHAFEPAMSMTLRTERSVDNIVSIAYDRDVPGEDARAMQCHDELLRELTAADFYPYRLGIHSIGKVPPRKPSSQALLGRLKAALDPDWILAPGRYD